MDSTPNTYVIVTDKPIGKLCYVNKIKVSKKTLQDCLQVVLYNEDLIRESLNKIREHGPSEFVFVFPRLRPVQELVFTSDNYKDLLRQWESAMVEDGVENYQLAAELRDFFKD